MPENDQYIRPGEICWGVHFNMLRPARGIALDTLPETIPDQPKSHTGKNKDQTAAFAPFKPGSETPDMSRTMPAYSYPCRPRHSRSAILYRTEKAAVAYWNHRVKINANAARARMQALIDSIESQYITEDRQ